MFSSVRRTVGSHLTLAWLLIKTIEVELESGRGNVIDFYDIEFVRLSLVAPQWPHHPFEIGLFGSPDLISPSDYLLRSTRPGYHTHKLSSVIANHVSAEVSLSLRRPLCSRV